MLSQEDLQLTQKYMAEYSQYCADNVCGDECPVFLEHERHPEVSCFKLYCQLRESGKLSSPYK